MSTQNITKSYEFQNNIRDVNSIFQTVVAESPTLLSLLYYNPSEFATNTKYEWLEDVLAPTGSTITSFDSTGDGTGINVVSTVGFAAGDIVRFQAANGASKTELAKVTSVDSATDLTIARDYGGSTGVTLVAGDVIKLMSSAKAEGSEAGAGTSQEPGTNFNYTQIFEATAQLSKTAANVGNYGFGSVEDKLDYQVGLKMKQLMYQMENAAIYSRRVARSSSENGTMGGVLQYLEGGNVTNVGGALTATSLNDIMEDIFTNGGYSDNFAIVCSENQSRKISAFNAAGVANSPVRTTKEDRSFGGYITEFVGDLPVKNGFRAPVVVSPLFPKDQIAILDMNAIALKNLQNRSFQDMDATLPGADYFRRRILGEYTLEFKNATKTSGLLTGLTI